MSGEDVKRSFWNVKRDVSKVFVNREIGKPFLSQFY